MKLDSQTTSQQTINIQLFTTANNSNECSEVKAKTITIPKTQAVATETAKKLFSDQVSFFNGFNKYLKRVYTDNDILYLPSTIETW